MLSGGSSGTNLTRAAEGELASIRAAGTYKSERVITSAQGAHISVAGRAGTVLNLCANNYLGLSSDPAIVAAAKAALDTAGFGMSSVRFICGTHELHKTLEARIARFHGTEDAIVFPSCFDANAGFEALLGENDAVISDELNHASIIDGIRLCKAQRHRYKHLDLADLEAKLIATASARVRLIVTAGVFSMDGDVAPLAEIVQLARRYDAQIFIDECHATGFFGRTGRGTDEHCNVRGEIDIINSTLGKALGGGTGGYTASSRAVVDLLRQRARPYLFSNAVPPSTAAASIAAFDKLETGGGAAVAHVRKLTHRFRDGMSAAGFTLLGDRDHPICPVLLGDARVAAAMADALLARGLFVVGFSYPVVPKGRARIRTQISAAHTEADIDFAVAAFTAVGTEMRLVGPGAAAARAAL